LIQRNSRSGRRAHVLGMTTSGTAILRREHDLILTGIRVLRRFRDSARAGETVDWKDVGLLLEFFARFADDCHHAKEEGALFPALVERGLPSDGGPVAVMLHEHEEGRGLLVTLRAEAPMAHEDPEAARRFAQSASEYATLLEHHISKENEVLFVMAERMIPPSEDGLLVDAFAKHERAVLGPAEHDRLQQNLHDLARRYL
jgi:hemerythrin-like domain-containing protein